MNTSSSADQFLTKAHSWLRRLAQDQVQPPLALKKLEELHVLAHESSLELIWETTALSTFVHYDLLITQAEGTTSLSYCPKTNVPWPLRGVQRWSDKHVVRINGELLDVETLIAKLDFIWSDTRLLTRLVDECLIRQEVSKRGIQLSDAELQVAMNNFRIKRGLIREEETCRWMEARGLNHERFEGHVEAQALAEKLKQEIAGGDEELYFKTHWSEFDEVSVATVRSADADWLLLLKNELLRAGPEQLLMQVQAAIQEGKIHVRDFACKRLQKQEIDVMEDQIPLAPLSESVKGPFSIGNRFELIIILAHHQAEFDETTRAVCCDALFETWLKQQREKATVEWFWGHCS